MTPLRHAILTAAGLVLHASNVTAQGSFQVLHTFTDSEGAPVSLMQAADGNFYGTAVALTHAGTKVATIFKVAPSGSVTMLHTFPPTYFLGYLPAGLTQGSDGNLYGMTPGDPNPNSGPGPSTIFRITTSGTFSVVHEFNPPVIGLARELVEASDGHFYGVLNDLFSVTTAFRMTPAGDVTTLARFSGDQGGTSAVSSLIQARDGHFYGTTSGGGAFNAGTVFRMTADGVITVLYSFPQTLGPSVARLTEGTDGNLYGTTASTTSNHGSVFRISPGGDFAILHAFTGGADSGGLIQPLVLGSPGNFYGSTAGTDAGELTTIFEITPAGVKTILAAFGSDAGGDGDYISLVQAADGNLYGVSWRDRTFFKLPLPPLAPNIAAQPSDQVALVGQRVQLRVIVTANPPPTYQWQRSADHGSSWTDVPPVAPYEGTTTAVLTIASADLTLTGTQYRVVVTHPSGTLTSTAATLTVLDPTMIPSPVPGAVFTLTSASDQRWLTLPVVAGRSYCGQGAPARTATAAATPTLTVYRAAGNTVLATRTGVSGSACFVSPATETALLRVTQADASARTYRVRTVETTAWANWFFIGGSYTSYTLLRNTAETTVHATVTWRADTGAIVGSETASIAPGGVWSRDARRATTAGTTLGSVDVAHDGEPQALVGSQTTLSPVTGLAVDTVLRERMAW